MNRCIGKNLVSSLPQINLMLLYYYTIQAHGRDKTYKLYKYHCIAENGGIKFTTAYQSEDTIQLQQQKSSNCAFPTSIAPRPTYMYKHPKVRWFISGRDRQTSLQFLPNKLPMKPEIPRLIRTRTPARQQTKPNFEPSSSLGNKTAVSSMHLLTKPNCNL
jgi:hypothetical protein